ncbi:MAG: copper amine oxidase N-terminal domain-containing protein [Tissierellia bacterium]|nr:copper amine oxidase N-terminal domain-containing protein [Tissierellia bacterium]
MKKTWVTLFIIISLLLPIGVSAASAPQIQIQGKKVEAVPPAYIKNGRTYVPLRYVTEALGFTVDWIEDAQTVVIGKPGFSNLTLTIGKSVGRYGDKAIRLDASPEIRGDRTFVPLRIISENLGYKVQWINSTRTVIID